MARRVVIAGIGNPLASDDGVGVRAIQDWPRALSLPPGVRLLELGTLGPSALNYFESDEAAVLLDAVRTGRLAGAIVRAELSTLEDPSEPPLTVHDLGLPSLLQDARLLGRPLAGVLLGVEPASLEPGTALSPAVESALPRLRAQALTEARRLLDQPDEPTP